MSLFPRRLSVALGLLGVLILLAGATLMTVGHARLFEKRIVAPPLQAIESDSATVSHGAHIALTHGCQRCHGERYEGQLLLDAAPLRITAPNLTRGQGGIGERYTVADWDRAIRYGVRPDSTVLLMMPAQLYHQLDDHDTAALIAYLQALPPVDQHWPARKIRPLGRLLAATSGGDLRGQLPAPDARPAPAPPPGPTAAYGAYLASHTCVGCHGQTLLGGPHPDPQGPPAPSMLAAAAWPLKAFERALRTGERPSGARMDAHWMPWTSFKHFTDTEIEALHRFLHTLTLTAEP